MITTALSTIAVLGILIFVHELGHFLVAKWSGVTVLKFSFGFGPRLLGIKRGDTDYCISAIPLGGYVKMLGEEVEEEVDEAKLAHSFQAQPVFRRILIVLAGPVSNFILAIIIFAGIYAFAGLPVMSPEIGTVSANSPAEQAGLKPGDMVTRIGDASIESWDDLIDAVRGAGEMPVTVVVRRGTEEITFNITPRVMESKSIFGETEKHPVLGVTASNKSIMKPVNPVDAGYYSVSYTWALSKLFFTTMVKLVQGVVSVKALGGPILIAQMAGQQAAEGLLHLINFLAFISVNLAVLNLLPIPVLDGGHIFFFLIEAVLGRPLGAKKVEWATKIGMVLLLTLMVSVIYNDIMRLIPGAKPDFLP